MNKITMLSLIAIMLAALLITGCAKEKGTIKIGAIGPLTGGGASWGESDRNAIELAVEEINNAGGINGRLLQVIHEDGKCNGKDAVNAASKLITLDNVKIILGGVCSAETLAFAPIAEQNKVITFTIATAPDVSNAGDYVFRNAASDLEGGRIGAKMIEEDRIALISENTEYAMGIQHTLKEELQNQGKAIVADLVYDSDETDFRTYLLKIKNARPEAIFINPGTSTSSAGEIAKQMVELGMEDIKVYGNLLIGSKESLEIAGDALEGAKYFDAVNIGMTEKGAEFLSKYKQRFGTSPANDFYTGARYDSVYIIADALRECGENSGCIKDYLYKMQPYNGVIGTYTFDSNGDVIGIPWTIKEIRSGQSEIIDIITI